jgi:hypothetical protein
MTLSLFAMEKLLPLHPQFKNKVLFNYSNAWQQK